MLDITSGEQTVSAAGAVTGSLDTSELTGDFTLHVRIRTLAANKRILLVAEDTSDDETPFDDARPVALFDTLGTAADAPAGNVISRRKYEMPSTKFGAANTKLRLRCVAIDGSASAKVHAWIENTPLVVSE